MEAEDEESISSSFQSYQISLPTLPAISSVQEDGTQLSGGTENLIPGVIGKGEASGGTSTVFRDTTAAGEQQRVPALISILLESFSDCNMNCHGLRRYAVAEAAASHVKELLHKVGLPVTCFNLQTQTAISASCFSRSCGSRMA